MPATLPNGRSIFRACVSWWKIGPLRGGNVMRSTYPIGLRCCARSRPGISCDEQPKLKRHYYTILGSRLDRKRQGFGARRDNSTRGLMLSLCIFEDGISKLLKVIAVEPVARRRNHQAYRMVSRIRFG